jgi:hypothetical protein
VNSFVVSLLGLIPKVNIGEPAVIMAVISIVAIVRLQRRLHTGRNLIVLAITLLVYAAQFGFGVLLLVDSHDSNQLINLSIIVSVTLIVSLQRAWSLLKGKHLTSAGGTAVTGDHDPPHGPGPRRSWPHRCRKSGAVNRPGQSGAVNNSSAVAACLPPGEPETGPAALPTTPSLIWYPRAHCRLTCTPVVLCWMPVHGALNRP